MTEKKKRMPNMTPKMFDCIRTLLDSKAPYKEISKYLGVSVTVVGKVAGCESWEEYQAVLAAEAKKQREKCAAIRLAIKEQAKEAKAVEVVKETVPAAPAPAAEPKVQPGTTILLPYRHYELMNKQIELLTTISAKLAFIVDELTGVKSPRGGDPA